MAGGFPMVSLSSPPRDRNRYHFREFAMPWEITIINGTTDNRKPLGTRQDVVAAVAEAVPGVELQRPPMPPEEMLAMMPPAVRDAMRRPRLEADFEHDDLSIQFYTSDTPTIDWINAEVRGNGDPLPLLHSICANTGWSIIDVSENIVVDVACGGSNYLAGIVSLWLSGSLGESGKEKSSGWPGGQKRSRAAGESGPPVGDSPRG